MRDITYSREQLLRLRDSPLVKKPGNLPSIDQWIEYDLLYPYVVRTVSDMRQTNQRAKPPAAPKNTKWCAEWENRERTTTQTSTAI